MRLLEALDQLNEQYQGEAVIITGGYDQNLQDYCNDGYPEEEYNPDVDILNGVAYGTDTQVPAEVIFEVDEYGYTQVLSEPLMRIVTFEDYEKLGRNN